MDPVKDSTSCFDQMAIVEKYERLINYLYPIAQSVPRKHGVAKRMFLECLLGIPDLVFRAGKSNQISKIYEVDAALAHLRFWLRFLHSCGSITTNQVQASQVILVEIGKMVGSWIKSRKSKGQVG